MSEKGMGATNESHEKRAEEMINIEAGRDYVEGGFRTVVNNG